MAALTIKQGPSKWDIMLGFFEDKELHFTLDDGTVITMQYVDAMWDMHGCDPLGDEVAPGDKDYFNGGIGEGYLLRGPDDTGDYEIFVEYRVRSRHGLCSIVHLNQCDSAYMPRIWSEIMGLENTYTDSPS